MENLVKIFKALSDTNRLRILKMLERKELCLCEISAVLKLANSTVSKHLSILREVGLIEDTKDGKWVNFKISHKHTNHYINALLPLLQEWLPDDSVIKGDSCKMNKVDRNSICGR